MPLDTTPDPWQIRLHDISTRWSDWNKEDNPGKSKLFSDISRRIECGQLSMPAPVINFLIHYSEALLAKKVDKYDLQMDEWHFFWIVRDHLKKLSYELPGVPGVIEI